jgi:hypothetical protein
MMFFENLAKLPKATRIAISVVVVILSAAICYNWIVAPHTKYLSAAQRYEFVAGDLARKGQIIKSKTNLKKRELQGLQQRLAESREKFFTLPEAQKFFRELEDISNQAGCTVLSTNFLSSKYSLKPKSEKEALVKTSSIVSNGVVINFTATYESVMAFLTKLLDRPQKVAFDLLEMTSTGYNPRMLQCEATFTIFIINDKEIFSNE